MRYLYVDNNVVQAEGAEKLLELLRARGVPQANRVLERVFLEPGNAIPPNILREILTELDKRATV